MVVRFDDLKVKDRTTWNSNARWQPISLVKKEAAEMAIHDLTSRGVIRGMPTMAWGFFSRALIFSKGKGRVPKSP